MIIQVTGLLTAIITGATFFITIATLTLQNNMYMRTIQCFESSIIFIAFCFYLFILDKNWKAPSPAKLRIRFYDWILTTPLMLIVLILLYPSEKLTVQQTFSSNALTITAVCIMTVLMIVIGLYNNSCMFPRKIVASIIGFILLIGIFVTIYLRTGVARSKSQTAFWYTVIIWTLYGFVYFLPFTVKNVAYNILDLLAKSIFGLLLATKIFKVQYPLEDIRSKH